MAIDAPSSNIGSEAPDLTGEELKTIHRLMIRVRTFDERGMNLQRQGRINFYVPSTGQEATQAGAAWAFEKDDWVFPSYRDPGVWMQRGATLVEMAHQLFGNRADRIHGRQMPNHYAFREFNLPSVSSPIATQIPHAVGVAMAMKIKKTRSVAGVYLGDGGTSEGDFHVACNFAGVFRSPVVFLCVNNQWAITVPCRQQTACDTFAVKAKAYGFPGVRVDGNDVLAVYQVVREAVDRARAGDGPTLVEMVTYRMGPHSTSDDPRRYRSDAEVEEWKRKDPIVRFKKYLLEHEIVSEDEEAAMWEEEKEEVVAAIREAEAQPDPKMEDVFKDVFAEMTPDLRAQMEEMRRFHPDHE